MGKYDQKMDKFPSTYCKLSICRPRKTIGCCRMERKFNVSEHGGRLEFYKFDIALHDYIDGIAVTCIN